jgi:prepilin-type N-terminal cleavage/methylation domain-containing protein
VTQRQPQRGFTLIELMVALVVSSLLVGMILAIFARMSMSYRGQQQIAGVQQVLAAARATMELDAKQAGLELAQGFRIASDGGTVRHPAVSVTANATGADAMAFYYADTSTQAVVTGTTAWGAGTLTVDNASGFVVASNPTTNPTLVVMVNINTSTANGAIAGLNANDAVITEYDACVLQLLSVSGNQLQFSTALPWGTVGEAHCSGAGGGTAVVPSANQTMIFNFVARAYRIDTSTAARAALGPLQVSQTGALLTPTTDWLELAYGFTDIQLATRFYEAGSITDGDADGDPLRNWYSSTSQTTQTAAGSTLVPLQMTISLVARTDRPIEGISTPATPTLINTAMPLANNNIGDKASVTLPSATDPALQGLNIYRYITFQVDLRNLGVGR